MVRGDSTTHDTPAYLFAYCERAGDAGLWAEPLNFITNAFFLLFAWFGWRILHRQPDWSLRTMGDIWVLVIAMALIGLGSGLWHSWAAPGWTVIVDVVPIALFINVYLFSLYRRRIGLSWPGCIAVWFVFTALNQTVQFTLPAETLNGSLMYLPTLGLMLVSAAWLRRIDARQGKALLGITALFTLSLTFRTLDRTLCDTIPFGTHFLWHMLNAVVLYQLVVLLLKPPRASYP